MPVTAPGSAGGGGGHEASSSATATASSLPVLRVPASPRTGGSAPFKSMASSRNVVATATTSDFDRKRRLIRRVPLLKQLVIDQLCTEEQLATALTAVSFVDGEYIYCQGQAERDLYFIEDGKVLITQRPETSSGGMASVLSALALGPRTRRRSLQDAECEIQIHTLHQDAYFGELALLQNQCQRKSNAVASGAVQCLVLPEHAFETLLRPVHSLMLYRHLLRVHGVLERDRVFKEWTPAQRQHLIDRCSLQAFGDGELICRQGETESDQYFILVEGEADVVLDEATSVLGCETVDGQAATSVVARKSIFQGFGEMGLLGKPRTASVVAVGSSVRCVVITRAQYIAAAQLTGTASALDVDAEALLATTLMEEWKLVISARHLRLSNPQVAHYLVTFIKKFKAAYHQKFAGKTLYLDLFRRLHQEPWLADEFAFASARITWDSPASSLGIIRSETRRVLTKDSASRTPDETAFVARLIEHTVFLSKFDVPGPHIDRFKLARCLAKFVAFVHITKDAYLFRQGKIESRAFVILRGMINIVNEDVLPTASSSNTNANASESGSGTSPAMIKHHEVIATLSAGDSFGELSLVTRLQRSATTMAACDTDLLVFDRDHLKAVEAALPGVSVQQLMVTRAEFLARLSFFRGSDFGQCIRVAHDVHEGGYDARHLFLQDAVHQRTLYIVKSGEIGVFMKVKLPNSSPPCAAKQALVRVATIGAQEFFGMAIATANLGGAMPSPTGTSTTATSVGVPIKSEQYDLAAAVYMSTTRVEMLELSERGWRRLSPQCLAIVRHALLERHKWNDAMAAKRQQQTSPTHSVPATTYYHHDKPWQPLPASTSSSSGNPTGESMHLASTSTGGCAHSQLARHVCERQAFQSPFASMFPSEAPRSPSKASESRVGTATTPAPAAAAWGWRSPFSSQPPPQSSTSSSFTTNRRASCSLSPLISFGTSSTTPTGPPVDGSLSLLPRPPRGDRPTLLTIGNLSPRSTAAQHQRYTVTGGSHSAEKAAATQHADSTNLWKARSPLARRTEWQHIP
jgi:CRP-like cAMP-binding protein